MTTTNTQPLGIYIHIPYCVKKCPYCDFNSYGITVKDSDKPLTQFREAEYVAALKQELELWGVKPEWHGREVSSIFFGGGTPSLFNVSSIEEVLETVDKHFSYLPNTEMTLEVNPGTVKEELGFEKLEGFRRAGINRISLGGQSFSVKKLKALGRIHSKTDTTRAVQHITKAGFTNFNIDLMFGIRGETLAMWERDLKAVLRLNPTHVSTYCLTIEPGTEFFRQTTAGSVLTVEDELQAQMYEMAQTFLYSHGYQQYEISNFAKSGLECQHNLAYWQGRDYLGIGAGAHSFLKLDANATSRARRWSNMPGPNHYIERLHGGELAVQRMEDINDLEAKLEFFLLGLRCSAGIEKTSYEKAFGESFDDEYGSVVRELSGRKLVVVKDNKISLSEKGFLFSNSVFSSFADKVRSD